MDEPSAAALRSLEELRSVSSSVSKFVVTWDGLRSLIDSINSSLDSLSAQLDAAEGPLLQSTPIESPRAEAVESEKEDEDPLPQSTPIESPRAEAVESEKEDEPPLPQSTPIESPRAEAVESEKEDDPEPDDNALSDKEKGSGGGSEPEKKPEPRRELKNHGQDIDAICKSKAAKGRPIRRYIIARLQSGISQMYNEIPAALARAEDPAALVLGCVGQFFKQGKKTYQDPASVESCNRRAAILVLEFFLLSGRAVPQDQLDTSLSLQAGTAALTWKARMLHEGGVDKAGAEDALGLLLLIASFGIPPQFSKDDITSLIQLCNLKEKAGALRRSPNLVPKVSEIIEDMVKDGKHLAAAELVIAFDLQGKFPLLPLLCSYLDAITKEGVDGQKEPGAAKTTKQALEKQRSKLQTLANFLSDHDLHAENASLDLDATILKLEKDMTGVDEQKPGAKEKTEETTLERLETHPRPPKNLNTKRKDEETAPLETINPGPKPGAKEKTEETALERLETLPRPPKNLNTKRKAEETAPLETINPSPKLPPVWTNQNTVYVRTLTKHPNSLRSPVNMQMNSGPLGRNETHLKPPQIQNANNKSEESGTSAIRLQPSSLRTEIASGNAVSINMTDSISLPRPSSVHPHSVPGQMNMQMNRGPARTSPLNDVFMGMDSRYPVLHNRGPVLGADIQINSGPSTSPLNGAFPGSDRRIAGFLNRDTVPPVGNNTVGYLGNGLPRGGGYALPSSYHGSEQYNWCRDGGSRAGIPSIHHTFGLSQPGGGTEEYTGAHPEVRPLSAGQNMMMHVPLPHELQSRAPGSANRYNFADMV